MANELAASFPGVAVDNASEMPERATHMLLYLCEESWSDDRLAEQVKQVREARLPIVMAHENDTERGGVPFSRFFETTPQESTSSLCIIARRSELILAPPITGAHRGRPLPRPRHRLLFGAAPSGAASTRHPLALTLLMGPAKSLDVSMSSRAITLGYDRCRSLCWRRRLAQSSGHKILCRSAAVCRQCCPARP